MSRSVQRESGFTLIELLITVSLLGVASGAILTAMFTSMQTVEDTSTRFVNANNRNFSTKWIIPDVQAAESDPATGQMFTDNGLVEGQNLKADCDATTPVVQLTTPLDEVSTLSRAYWVGDECELLRGTWENSDPVEETIVLEGLRATDPVCIDHIRAGYDYAVNPPPAAGWCVPSASPTATYERPTLRIWIADNEDTPLGQYDYVITSSSRVGRVVQ